MKKILLGSSALLGVALFAHAASAEMTVKLGGSVDFQAGFFSDDVDGRTDREFRNETEILVNADGKADNGLSYGAVIEIENTTSNGLELDESNAYLSGSFGRVELGDQDGAADVFAVFAPQVGNGQFDGDYEEFLPEGSWMLGVKALDTGDATKITYYTPRMAGFQIGASYVPENDLGRNSVWSETARTGGWHDAFEIGANYKTEISGVQLNLGAGYVGGKADNEALENPGMWQAGAQVGYRGFVLGGSYVSAGDSLSAKGVKDDEITAWNVGLSYTQGPVGVAASMLVEDYERNSHLGEGDYTAYALGATYAVAPGLSVGSDLVFFDRDMKVDAEDNKGYVLLVSTKVAF